MENPETALVNIGMTSTDSKLFEAIFLQNWENARHLKNERIWFMNSF